LGGHIRLPLMINGDQKQHWNELKRIISRQAKCGKLPSYPPKNQLNWNYALQSCESGGIGRRTRLRNRGRLFVSEAAIDFKGS
jgi:hypothetical protein